MFGLYVTFANVQRLVILRFFVKLLFYFLTFLKLYFSFSGYETMSSRQQLHEDEIAAILEKMKTISTLRTTPTLKRKMVLLKTM